MERVQVAKSQAPVTRIRGIRYSHCIVNIYLVGNKDGCCPRYGLHDVCGSALSTFAIVRPFIVPTWSPWPYRPGIIPLVILLLLSCWRLLSSRVPTKQNSLHCRFWYEKPGWSAQSNLLGNRRGGIGHLGHSRLSYAVSRSSMAPTLTIENIPTTNWLLFCRLQCTSAGVV